MRKIASISVVAGMLAVFAACGNDWVYPQSGGSADAGVTQPWPGERTFDSHQFDKPNGSHPSRCWFQSGVLVCNVTRTDAGTTVDAGSDAGCPIDDDDDKDNDHHKKLLCHVPRGNPSNCHNITVGEPALSAHLSHGDYLGLCH